MNQQQEFYPAQNGAFGHVPNAEPSFAFKPSKYEESGAKGCGLRPLCSKMKWVTETQTKCVNIFGHKTCLTLPHQKQVPAQDCQIKHDVYDACLAASGQVADTGMGDTGPDPAALAAAANAALAAAAAASTSTVYTPPPAPAPSNTKTILLISIVGVVIVAAIIIISMVIGKKKKEKSS